MLETGSLRETLRRSSMVPWRQAMRERKCSAPANGGFADIATISYVLR
jgi:hypothetical protein